MKKNLSTVFLIISIILIVLMSVLMHIQATHTKEILSQSYEKISQLHEKVSDLESTLDWALDILPDKNYIHSIRYNIIENSINKNLIVDDSLSMWDENIIFFPNKSFSADLDGGSLYGNYTIKDNIIDCTVSSYTSEYTPAQSTSANISFEIINDSTIKVISASETFRIYIGGYTENYELTLTDEEKDMYLTPFIPGITFRTGFNLNK